MNGAGETAVTPLTVGVIVVVIGVLAAGGIRAYAWIRAQVGAERALWEARFDADIKELKSENAVLRVEMDKLKIEIHDLQNGKAKALQHLGRALGAGTMDEAKRHIDAGISALAPVG